MKFLNRVLVIGPTFRAVRLIVSLVTTALLSGALSMCLGLKCLERLMAVWKMLLPMLMLLLSMMIDGLCVTLRVRVRAMVLTRAIRGTMGSD